MSAFVQLAQGANDAAGTTIATASFGASVAAGSAFFWAVSYFNSSGIQTVSVDGNSNTYTEMGSIYDATQDVGMAWGYAKNVNSGTTGATATFGTSSARRGIILAEYSGMDTGTLVGAGEAAGQPFLGVSSATDAVTTGNATPTVQPGRIVGICANMTAGNHTEGTGFTSRGTLWDWGFGLGDRARLEDKVYSSLSADDATWTAAGGDSGLCCMVMMRDTVISAVRGNLLTLGVG